MSESNFDVRANQLCDQWEADDTPPIEIARELARAESEIVNLHRTICGILYSLPCQQAWVSDVFMLTYSKAWTLSEERVSSANARRVRLVMDGGAR